MTASSPRIRVEGMRKSFFGHEVLKGVGFEIGAGEVLGLVGENGAGKSTLMNLLGGGLQPDAGRMELEGGLYAPRRPGDAEQRGVAFIHQELNLFPNLSIAENLFINAFPRRWRWLPWMDRRRIEKETADMLAQVGLNRPPGMLVEGLPAGERQLVEIAKALRQRSRLIIFDEPTTSLAEPEIRRLFALIERLRSQGLALIFISHNLAHVLERCDRLLVLRDGAAVGAGPVGEFTLDALVTLMVGRPIENLFPPRTRSEPGEVALEVRDLSQPYVVKDVSFKARRGEVLGVAGLMGSGRSELMRILCGLDPCAEGEVILNGRRLTDLTPRARVAAGLAFLTEDRREEGLALDGSIRDNVTSVVLPKYSSPRLGWIDRSRLDDVVATMTRRVRLSEWANPALAVKTLSGGNQQKVVLAKWLLNDPAVLILDEPTRGVDVGAKYEIYTLIDELAARGKTVLMVSSEIEELIGLCDRILVMCRGEVSAVVDPPGFDRERILKAALNGKETA